MIVLFFGVALGILALLALIFLVIAPPAPRVPIERRRAPGTVQVSSLTKVTNKTVGAIESAMRSRGEPMVSPGRLEQASISLSPPAFILMVVCATVVLASLGVLAGRLSAWSVPLAVLFAALGPLGAYLVLQSRTAARRARFADQLDDTLALLAGGLRAGHSLLRAVDAVSQETEDPTSTELARVVNESRIGRDLGDALDNTAERMRSDDFRWVAQAIAINREVGGNLADVFDQVGHTIRERNQIRRQVRSLSAEGRLSAIILIALPIGVFTFLFITQPNYFAGFFSNIFGIIALAVAVVLLIVGAIWLMFTVRVKF
jgi:tight adherence protein B